MTYTLYTSQYRSRSNEISSRKYDLTGKQISIEETKITLKSYNQLKLK